MNLKHNILNKIKKENIEPKARWTFLLRDWVMWGVGLLCLIVGSLAFAIILHMFKSGNWDLYRAAHGNVLAGFFSTLPYLWLLLLAIFIFVAYYNFTHTKKGYKFGIYTLILAAVLASILFGTGLYAIGAGSAADEVLSDRLPLYNRIGNRHRVLWNRPEEGLLIGRVIEVNKDKKLLNLLDIKKENWKVLFEHADLAPQVRLEKGIQLRMIGEKLDDKTFDARKIAPFFPEGEMIKIKFLPGIRPPMLPIERN